MSIRGYEYYKELVSLESIKNWNDHTICVKLGAFLDSIAGVNRLEISSVEELAVGYYRKCVKHEKLNQRVTNASFILRDIEAEYERYYGAI